MADALRSLLGRRSFRRQVRLALEGGIGLYQQQWPLTGQVPPPHGAAWPDPSRIGAGRRSRAFQRPYGVDHVTLTAAVIDGEGRELAVAQFGMLRPADFYAQGPAEQQLRESLEAWDEAGLLASVGDCRLVAVLFSWGDLTRALLPAG